MTDREFLRLRQYVKDKYGIDMTRKREVVDQRMSNFVDHDKYSSFTDYLNAMELDRSGLMEKKLMNVLTINHTFFLREAEHFEYLVSTVLPYLKEKEKETKDLGIWCGAAASGEEPYTLAMVLMDYFGLEHNSWDTTILATDISTKALTKAVEGIYDEEQISAFPDGWRRKYIKKLPDGKFQMTDEIKNEIMFRNFNLMSPFRFKRKFHIVFLRNVMIYFDDDTKTELLTKIYNNMEPGGYLFIGRTETLDRKKIPFQMIQPSIFRKAEA